MGNEQISLGAFHDDSEVGVFTVSAFYCIGDLSSCDIADCEGWSSTRQRPCLGNPDLVWQTHSLPAANNAVPQPPKKIWRVFEASSSASVGRAEGSALDALL